ncbi:syndecan 4-B-like [Bufo gargarizans]|uniref:syndecan 4-B-like n=1 Tax=Bufo gargarizans TaxID=30331 RepID=UPI001CF5921E|nr:syndecan 4-B-like [Bufo gargarizans]
MNVRLVLFLVGCLLSAAVAESIRETELMDPHTMIGGLLEASGADDEDIYTDNYDDEDSDDYEGSSGSGDIDEESEDDLESTISTPTVTLGNKILEDDVRKVKDQNEVVQINNDIEVLKETIPDDQSNQISMASTSHGFFSRTEVVIAVVAGGLVGLVFAIIIVLLIMRVRKNKKGDIAYDTVKKPIYKKAPTIEA